MAASVYYYFYLTDKMLLSSARTRKSLESESYCISGPYDKIPWPNISASVSVLMIALAGISCFINSYSASFAFDDSEAIQNNKDVWSGEVPVLDLFIHDFWGSVLASNTSHKSYRPFTVLSFRFDNIQNISVYNLCILIMFISNSIQYENFYSHPNENKTPQRCFTDVNK